MMKSLPYSRMAGTCMSNSLYGSLHIYRDRNEPSAAELLEASKGLYVKADHTKTPIASRFVQSPREDGYSCRHRPIVIPVKPSGSTSLRPSINSAFRPILKETPPPTVNEETSDETPPIPGSPPTRPPKSTRIRQRARRLHNETICVIGIHRGSPPPTPPVRTEDSGLSEERLLRLDYNIPRRKSAPSVDCRPVPAPRLSKMSCGSNVTPPIVTPRPLPRRRTIQFDGSILKGDDMTKSSPELSPVAHRISPCHPSTLIRKRMAPTLVRPATPLPNHDGLVVSKEDTKAKLSSPTSHSERKNHQLIQSASFPLSSPTSKATSKDSGVQPSDEEDDDRKYSDVSEEVIVVVEDDDESIFTSITNQPRREEMVVEDKSSLSSFSSILCRPLSVIEKHARVITWLKTSSSLPSNDDSFTDDNSLTV